MRIPTMGLPGASRAARELIQGHMDQLDDLAKAGLHIGRQRSEFISNSIVEQFYDPSNLTRLSHFCNIG